MRKQTELIEINQELTQGMTFYPDLSEPPKYSRNHPQWYERRQWLYNRLIFILASREEASDETYASRGEARDG